MKPTKNMAPFPLAAWLSRPHLPFYPRLRRRAAGQAKASATHTHM